MSALSYQGYTVADCDAEALVGLVVALYRSIGKAIDVDVFVGLLFLEIEIAVSIADNGLHKTGDTIVLAFKISACDRCGDNLTDGDILALDSLLAVCVLHLDLLILDFRGRELVTGAYDSNDVAFADSEISK